jgi:hypothetical protein
MIFCHRRCNFLARLLARHQISSSLWETSESVMPHLRLPTLLVSVFEQAINGEYVLEVVLGCCLVTLSLCRVTSVLAWSCDWKCYYLLGYIALL